MSKDDKGKDKPQARTEEYYKNAQAPEPPGQHEKYDTEKSQPKNASQKRDTAIDMPSDDFAAPDVKPMERKQRQPQARTEEYYKNAQAPEPPGQHEKYDTEKSQPKNASQKRDTAIDMPSDDFAAPDVKPMERKQRQPQARTEEYYKNAQAPEPPGKQSVEQQKPPIKENKTPKQSIIEGLNNTRGVIDKELPKLLAMESEDVKAEMLERTQQANQRLKGTIDQTIEVFESAPDDSSPMLANSGQHLNRLVKMAQSDYVEQSMANKSQVNGEATEQGKTTPFATKEARDKLVDRLESTLDEHADKLIQAARADVVEAEVRLEKKSTQNLSDIERATRLESIVMEVAKTHKELAPIQEKLHKDAEKKGKPNLGISQEQSDKLNESVQKIKHGVVVDEDVKKEINSMKETINESLPTSRKIASAVAKKFRIGTQRPNTQAAKDQEEQRLRVGTEKGTDKKKKDPLDILHETEKEQIKQGKKVKGSALDALQEMDNKDVTQAKGQPGRKRVGSKNKPSKITRAAKTVSDAIKIVRKENKKTPSIFDEKDRKKAMKEAKAIGRAVQSKISGNKHSSTATPNKNAGKGKGRLGMG